MTFVNCADIGRRLYFAIFLPNDLDLFHRIGYALEPLHLDRYAALCLVACLCKLLLQLLEHVAWLVSAIVSITYYSRDCL